jgi:hypothetical protein
MNFICTYKNALSDSLCDELIERFEKHPGRHQGLVGSGVDTSKKLSTDLTMDHFHDLKEILAKVNDNTYDYAAEYFLKYPPFGGLNPVLRRNDTGVTREVTPDNLDGIDQNMMRMIVTSYFRIGTVNIQKYDAGKGGYPHWHSEIFPESSGDALRRILTILYYLNDVEVGGETDFLFLDTKAKPTKGTLVIKPAGFTHTHRGNVPESGDKYILTSWLLFK